MTAPLPLPRHPDPAVRVGHLHPPGGHHRGQHHHQVLHPCVALQVVSVGVEDHWLVDLQTAESQDWGWRAEGRVGKELSIALGLQLI